MTHVSPIGAATTPAPDPGHPSVRHWAAGIAHIDAAARERALPAGRVVVLVPYAQLMDAGRRAWAAAHPSGFAPRFESTRNWAASLRPFLPGPGDLSMDMARDSLMAAALIERVAPARADAALRTVMVGRLVDAARQLAPWAAAVPPEHRLAWAEPLRAAMAPTTSALHWEGLLATLALTWVSTSAYATDVLWAPMAQPGAHADLLVVLQGFQDDPLATALAARWGDRALVLPLGESDWRAGEDRRLHACGDAEDEAQRAAACVIEHINQGRTPVALVANDRLLTRRVSAMLHRAGISVRDETGWKLSTTRAAAQLMSVLRAADARAAMDDVLDLLKQATAWPDAQGQQLEQLAREFGVSRWKAAVQHARLAPAIPQGLPAWIEGLQAARPLTVWLGDLALALKACGLWTSFETDPAGQQLLQALRLGDGAAMELAGVAQAVDAAARSGSRMSLSAFTAWVRDVLEGASFMPRSEGETPVVVLPMAQLLGRHFPATVVPGCDETHLSPSPEPPGDWTAAQRELLGLPSREALAQAAAKAWQATLALPQLDLLWRTQDRGEATLPSAWLQALLPHAARDPREPRVLVCVPQEKPMPSARDVLPEALSASAYQDLRDCPYRFFALRQLRLSEAAELEAEPDQRDMGNWLHAVLRSFHEQRRDARPGREADRAALDRLADETASAMGLNAGEGGAGFLPYQAVWPALREGYLDWLTGFEATEHGPGPRFAQAEAERTSHTGPWKLYGKLDRIDLQHSPEGPIPFVLDYKTESRSKTQERVKEPLEDTQLAFYAALLPDENLRAAYLSITDKRGDSGKDTPTWLVEQPDVLMAREQLREGLAHDMARVAAGQPMPALGEGRVCDFCAARGLCRKDFWSAA
ncbi:PD-(D/E)XK nuclease family protein [Hydrogenophaga sp. BPS33]|uniref:PD-(D/E)XK nuclease family protein n=1 Tax=Hydrogenophaga sp. BPS33 TaxID=2651974 RepID=UPI00132005B6|nr:PD-(D/E)XK nuclease family protein [Hydrogenophaga sp. BPS33]QHE86361.1 PD-(D/E)XK nuclease family protein [Hydrogenophaga sp. BPS33]